MNNNNEGKSNLDKAIPILITAIAVLLLVIGILAGMYLMNSKKDNTAENSVVTNETAKTEIITSTGETPAQATDTAAQVIEEIEDTTKATTSPAPTTEKATTKPAAPKPSITASLEYVSNSHAGWDIYLKVSGDFSYYDWESYVTLPNNSNYDIQKGSSSDTYICICGTFEPQVSGTTNVCIITPYLNGIKGDIIKVEKSIDSIMKNSNENNSTKKVTSCTKYGTIYSPSGSKVDGLTRSYLIDGGAATYERHDLTHGWHITAVNQYFDGSTYWYELYDSDDGDYYGWVASYNISFY